MYGEKEAMYWANRHIRLGRKPLTSWKIQNSNNYIWEPVKDADSGIHSRLTENLVMGKPSR